MNRTATFFALAATLALPASMASANHSWRDGAGNPYRWAKTNIPLRDSVTTTWDAHLARADLDWSCSSVLNGSTCAGYPIRTSVTPRNSNPRTCKPLDGEVEVCNATYGSTGWLGIAQIWTSGGYIVKGAVKLNDTYFNTATYNKAAWRRFVTCQEVGHTLGLTHDNEAFEDNNNGTCMDYTNDPDGDATAANDPEGDGDQVVLAGYGPSNEHPNTHDYDQLTAVYGASATVSSGAKVTAPDVDGGNSPAEWGRAVAFTRDGRGRVYERVVGPGRKVITHVLWASPTHR